MVLTSGAADAMSGANLIPLGVRAGGSGGGGGFGRDAELLSLLKGAGRGLDRSKKGK